ncbi:MAG: cation-translocating P-type ATPase [Candidatus Poribacteria bacterium]|nr:cation-translocating P-type ATPase [Candidatus Poribacteria bacterium]
MHEGDHGVLTNPDSTNTNRMGRYRRFFFPISLLFLIILSAIQGISGLLDHFDLAIIPMLLGGGFITYTTLVSTIEKKQITAGLLVVIALFASAIAGEHLAASIAAFIMISGEFLEDLTLAKTRNAVQELIELVPDEAWISQNNHWINVPISQIRVDDLILVKPGERVPIDGQIVKGDAAINESALNGESMPVDKTVEDMVFAGTINEMGAIEVKVTKIGDETAIGRIIDVVYQAQKNKGRTQRVADRFAQYFTPLILAVATIIFFVTLAVHQNFDQLGTFATGLSAVGFIPETNPEVLRKIAVINVTAVLLIACPCALVLATPTAVIASVGNAAKKGVLIKGGITVETAGQIDTICFDKTGTLTCGKPQVVAFESFGIEPEQKVLQLALTAEIQSEHPVARALINYAQNQDVQPEPINQFEQVFGIGVKATLDPDQEVWVGNRKILEQNWITPNPLANKFLKQQESEGNTALLVVLNGQILGGISVADTVKPDANQTIRKLYQTGIKNIIMLTGDNETSAQAIAKQVGINTVKAELLPEEKLEVIRQIQSENRIVAMVGDGINDAPALMLSDVGIAMGAAGTDVAIESADIVLMNDNLELMYNMLSLSRRTLSIIRQNILGFAVGMNVIGILLAGSGILSPIMAAVVHNVSSAFVVLNSARLLRFGEIEHRH